MSVLDVVGEVVVRCKYGDPLPNLACVPCERTEGRTPATCRRCVRTHVEGEPFRRLKCIQHFKPDRIDYPDPERR